MAQVKQVCNLVARRSAAVVAACLAGLLKQIDRDGVHMPMAATTIAVDGGLFEHYQAYRGYLREYLDQMLGKQVILACHTPCSLERYTVQVTRPDQKHEASLVLMCWKSPEWERGSASSAALRSTKSARRLSECCQV